MVTGGAGFIGSHLVDELIRRNNHVVVIDNFNDYYHGKERNLIQHKGNPLLTLIRADILDFPTLSKAMSDVVVVFHLAAQPGVRFSLEDPVTTNNVNTWGTINVLQASMEMEVKKVIYASSSSVYGNVEKLPIDEETPLKPISPYGASKLAAEHYCRIFHESHNLEVTSLRYFTVYGPRQRPDMAIHKFVKQIYEGRPLTIYGGGTQTRDFTYIDDVIQGTIAAAETDNIGGDVFNIGSGRRITLNDLIKILEELTEKITVKYEPSKKGDVKDTHADISKAKNSLGYKTKTELKDGLKKFIEWYKEKECDSV